MPAVLTDLAKRLPIDVGQARLKHRTKGKQIALSLIGEGEGHAPLLDLGCRDGYYSEYFARRGYAVTSVDLDCGAYGKCRPMDANDPFPFPDDSFDIVWCSEVIEHVRDPEATLGEIRRVLRPSGRAILTTPNSSFWPYRLLSPFGIHPRELQNDDHKHFFSVRDIQSFAPAGDVLGYFPYLLVKYTIRRLANILSPTFVFVITKRHA
jgi:SAM-dependent methyltransferase